MIRTEATVFIGMDSAAVAESELSSRAEPAPEFSFADTPTLTRALRAADEAAFRWLHTRWNPRLFRYSFALAQGDDSLTSEIVQATYLRMVRHMRELPNEEALWNWIAQAARCAATDLRRRGNRYRRALERFTSWMGLTLEQAGTDTTLHDPEQDLFAALDKAIASLTTDERLLLEARYFARRRLAEVAGVSGSSARAVEGRLARIRQKLRQRLTLELSAHPPSTGKYGHERIQ